MKDQNLSLRIQNQKSAQTYKMVEMGLVHLQRTQVRRQNILWVQTQSYTWKVVQFLRIWCKSNFAQVWIEYVVKYVYMYVWMYVRMCTHAHSHTIFLLIILNKKWTFMVYKMYSFKYKWQQIISFTLIVVLFLLTEGDIFVWWWQNWNLKFYSYKEKFGTCNIFILLIF